MGNDCCKSSILVNEFWIENLEHTININHDTEEKKFEKQEKINYDLIISVNNNLPIIVFESPRFIINEEAIEKNDYHIQKDAPI